MYSVFQKKNYVKNKKWIYKKKSKKKGKFEMIKGNLLISNTSKGHYQYH